MTRTVPVSAAVLGIAMVVWSVAQAADPTPGQPVSSSPTANLRILKKIDLGGSGAWDSPIVDDKGKLYIPRASRLMVVDPEAGKLAGEINELNGAKGVALFPEKNQAFVTNSRDSQIVIVDLAGMRLGKKLKSGQDPDSIAYDPSSKKIFAFGGRAVTVVNPASPDQEPQSAPIGAKLASAVADGKGRMFVTDENKNSVLVLDCKAQKVSSTWTLDAGKQPSGIAFNPEQKRLYVTCGNSKLVVLDSESSKIIGSATIGQGADGVAWDPVLGIIVANGKDGTVSVIRENPAGTFNVVQTLTTAPSARVLALDPKSHKVYIPAMIPGEKGAPTSFGVYVIGEKT